MSNNITEVVRDKYGAVAVSHRSSEQTGVRSVAEAFGYSSAELASIPAEANMGLSCGNPTATANLRAGETVVDLGSGGGLDVFLAAAKVGASGRAIGIDMTPEMIDLARRNAERGDAEGKPYTNVEFHLATIDNLPLPDASVDCVISNCVINLAADKNAVFHEISRVLKPGGRLAVSDIALKQPLPAEMADDVMAYVGCISGALLVDEFREGLRAAGFSKIEIVDSGADLNAYAAVEGQEGCCSPAMNESTDEAISESKTLPLAAACCSPAPMTNITTDAHSDLSEILRRYNVSDYAASFKIFALKEEA
ncbi:MAG: arsenite methyltransferase [Pyrinomonadaceae bacterium MAG19_C2-C3]|nr:arsenite methyltransferase [Pyrinomonadaceae bacterium MAG19_C2-C3]